tara:strand:+ start:1067 stop:1387 length:321 start_codon:yes stop_codon:yes gene_type:complete
MKKYLLIILLLIGCSDNVPENLISKKNMENIIFDIIILNASSTYEFKIDKNFLSDEIIFKKYNIDSTQLYESELYYSKNPKIHFEIYENVQNRIKKSLDSIKTVNK